MSQVMKMLTSISIILMFPTLIASLFGMNLINGMEQWTWGFPIALVLSVGVTVAFMWYFKRKTWI
jgi:magnesium transporter